MVCGNGSPSHDRSHYRYFCLIDYFCKYLVCPGNIHASACKEQRLLRFFKHLESALELSHMDAGIGLVAPDIYSFRIFRASQLAHNVFGKVDKNRSRTACSGYIKSFLDDTSQILTVAHCYAVFCNAPGNSYDIHFLESVVSDQVPCHLSCETD